ncbi:alpha/beta hydrolase [Kribbella deserti]|uniref:Alpha/beta hydrolase n=1 Tax=Kribbella deserti TaxID=1926257 RepID=A0ABV6QDE9_9ACTN
MLTRRRTSALVLAAALVAPLAIAVPAATAAAPTAASTAARGPVVPKIAWGSCGDKPELKPFQCASVEVPTDYDKPRGATTTIALTRLPATNPGAKLGTVFMNPGGPGGPGVQTLHQIGLTAYSPQLRARFDILGFDPRGVGLSDPTTCFPTAAEEAKFFEGQEIFPLGKAQEREYLKGSIQLALNCMTTSPDRFAHMSTANVARDMDLLRQAVGDKKLTYIGYSYGTYLGATYAKLFPGKVRALVLDGTMQPEWYSGSDGDSRPLGARIRQGEGGTEVLAEFNRQCAQAGASACPLAGLGDPAKVTEAMLQRLKVEPAVVTLPDGTKFSVNYQTAVMTIFFGLYDPAGYADLSALITQLAVASGQSAKRATVATQRVPSSVLSWIRRAEDYSGIGSGLQPCIESRQSGRPFAYPQYADAADKVAPHFGRARTWIGQPCEFMPIRDTDAYLGPWKQTTKEPVLVIGTKFDPATPYRATRPYTDFWPNGRMVTVNGWGHTMLYKSKCADNLITNYLVDLKAPADGTTCEQDRKPFDPLPMKAKNTTTMTPLF